MINKICYLGLIPYLLIYFLKNSYIALAIFINGLIFHSSHNTKYYKSLFFFDTLINIIFTVYINIYTKWKYESYMGTFIAGISFIIENNHFGYDFLNDYIHIFLVQILLSIGLYKFYD